MRGHGDAALAASSRPLTRLHSVDHFRLDRHPGFVAYLNALPRCDVVLHGLHHAHVGPQFAAEFQGQTARECQRMVQQGAGYLQRCRDAVRPRLCAARVERTAGAISGSERPRVRFHLFSA